MREQFNELRGDDQGDDFDPISPVPKQNKKAPTKGENSRNPGSLDPNDTRNALLNPDVHEDAMSRRLDGVAEDYGNEDGDKQTQRTKKTKKVKKKVKKTKNKKEE